MSEQLRSIEEQLARNAEYYGTVDTANITLSCFAKAALVALRSSEGQGFRDTVDYMIELRPELKGPTAVKLLERAYQTDLLEHDVSYPYGYQDEAPWLKTFSSVNVHDDFLRWGLLANNAALRNVQSCVDERYKTIKLFTSLVANRFDAPPTLLDVGSSVLHGDLKLVYESDPSSPVRPFQPIEILNDKHEKAKDERLTKLANVALSQQIQFGHVMGVDITDIDDVGTRRWARGCRFYPDELFQPDVVEDYDLLESTDPDHSRVSFLKGDFATMTRNEVVAASPVSTWDIIAFSTVFYQVSSSERIAMLLNALNLLSDNGLIIIQDAREVIVGMEDDVEGNFSIPFNYATSIIDAQRASDDYEEPVIAWENGRCQRAVFEPKGRIRVNGGDVPIDEALEMRFGNAV